MILDSDDHSSLDSATGNLFGLNMLENQRFDDADVQIIFNRLLQNRIMQLIRDRYDSMVRIGQVRAPILLFHGDADTTIPVRFARRLHEAAPEPKEAHFLPGGGHTDLYDLGAGELVIDFLERRTASNSERSGSPEPGA